jgi:hypothetical protein
MRHRVLLALAVALAGGGRAGAQICTVSDARVLVRNFDLEAPLPTLTGLGIPIEIAETSGNFRVDFAAIPPTTFSLVGVASDLVLPQQGIDGSLDASGNVTIPNVEIGFVTEATNPPTALSADAVLGTGITALFVGGRDYVAEGATLDFATGRITLAGHGVVTDAPLAGQPVTTGFSVTCTLAPIPTQANLPPGPTLRKASGKGKFGKPPKDGSLVGDRLTVKATFDPADETLDLTALDLFVRIRPTTGATEESTLLVRVPGGSLQRRGKKLVASDEDGSVVRLIQGRKRAGNEAAPLGGSIVVKETKKGLAITLKQEGVDLASVPAGAADVSVVVGDFSGTVAATLSATRKGVTIK